MWAPLSCGSGVVLSLRIKHIFNDTLLSSCVPILVQFTYVYYVHFAKVVLKNEPMLSLLHALSPVRWDKMDLETTHLKMMCP